MSLSIDIASSATEELLNGLNNLVPQLSSSAAPLTIGDVEALIANPAVSVFVAKNDGAIVGTLTLVVFPIPSGLRAWIEDVVVDEGARGLGAGAALTEAAVAESKKRGARSIDLTRRHVREVGFRATRNQCLSTQPEVIGKYCTTEESYSNSECSPDSEWYWNIWDRCRRIITYCINFKVGITCWSRTNNNSSWCCNDGAATCEVDSKRWPQVFSN